ncbi:B-cell lymphoma 3 protein homolog [Genypterus blacodes]|uniref:B-cell lymphoma 3 protein homolog n=1 Tax=Genypterus blacodes TaxID=154954 RepID=UPI003F76DB61
MPRIMTMNGDNQSAASAPLDLRTTDRERGSTGCRSPDCKGRARDCRAAGGSPAAPGRTGTNAAGLNCPTARGAPGSDTGTVLNRTADNSSSRLPFRKRPIPAEPEPQRPSPTRSERGDRLSPAEDADSTLRGRPVKYFGRPTRENNVWVPAMTPRRPEVSGQSLDVLRFIHSSHFYSQFPAYCLTPIPEPNHYLTYQSDNLLGGVALATRQDEDGDTALHIAVVKGEVAIVHRLIYLLQQARRGLDIYNNLRQTPLHLAVITQQAGMVEALLGAGADPTALDRNGQSALHLCCEYDQRDCLAVVLSLSSPATCLELRNYEGLTPLHLTVQRGCKDLARILLDAGADINALDIKSGQSPLMHAVESNNSDMVHFLIENSCDVNSQSYSGNTALHSACGRGQVDTVRLLLKSGADCSLKNYHNDTPVMVAKNKKIADVLRGRGSKQIKVQDQPYASVSPRGSVLAVNGSPSSNHSLGYSPSTTPHTPHHSASQSPKTPSTLASPLY